MKNTGVRILSVNGIPWDEYVVLQRAHERSVRAHWTALRRARLHQRSVKWANKAAVKAIYARAAQLSQETGIPHHVDHFYPLAGDCVSGLHVEFNLRIITAADNMAKGNRA